MKPKQIQRLRHALGESTEQFAARFLVSGRTVESWEQGRRRPPAYTLRELLRLAEEIRLTRNTTAA